MKTDVRRHYARFLLPVFPSLSYLLFGRSSGFDSSLESEMFIPLEGGFDSKKNRKGIFKKRWNLSPFLCTCMSHCLLCQDNCNGGKTDTLNVLGLCSGRPLLTRGGIVAGANVITLNICLGAGQPIAFCVFVVSVLVRHPSTGVPYMRAD